MIDLRLGARPVLRLPGMSSIPCATASRYFKRRLQLTGAHRQLGQREARLRLTGLVVEQQGRHRGRAQARGVLVDPAGAAVAPGPSAAVERSGEH